MAPHRQGALSEKAQKEALSYLQRIEAAVVAAFRKANMKPVELRAARDYVRRFFESEYPFAEHRFMQR